MKETKASTRTHGASAKGFHFLESFKTCKRKFFISEILGVESELKPFQLLAGSAFHVAKEAFYKGKKVSSCIKLMLSELELIKKEIEDSRRIFPLLKAKLPVMFQTWVDRLGQNDLGIYKILAVEEILSFKLPNGFTFTFKPDVVMKGPGGSIYLFDTKTSWYSANFQNDQVEVGDQASAYLTGWNRLHPKEKASGLVADCISWNIGTTDVQKIVTSRGNIVQRTELEQWEWEQGAMSDLLDMSSRVKALKKTSYAQLFPRTTSYCLAYNRRCEFLDICRSDLTNLKSLPGGFRHKPKDLKCLSTMKDEIPLISRPTKKVVK